MIEIDGTEGGGQVIRTALALSAVTGRAFRAQNIRAKRPEPGLKAQHITAVCALEKLTGAKAKAEPGGDTLEFIPGRPVPQTLSIDIGTAGSITLLMQALLLPCCLAEGKTRLRVRGGTDVKWSMPADYFLNIVLAHYAHLADFRVNGLLRGFYPKGQGFLDITIRPRGRPKPVILEKKAVFSKISGVSCASAELRSAEVAERQAKAAKKKLSSLDVPVRVELRYEQTACPGTAITLWTDNAMFGGDALGEPRKRSEAVGAEAAAELLLALLSDGAVDAHLADNLLPLLAVSGGTVRVPQVTQHISSAIYVCQKFGARFDVKGCLIKALPVALLPFGPGL